VDALEAIDLVRSHDLGSIVASVALLLTLSAAAEDWLGFHGLERQGAITSRVDPLGCPGEIKATWKTPIKGRGFSSPVVVGDKIFITTAYETAKGSTARAVATYAVGILALGLLAQVAVCVIGTLAREWPTERKLAHGTGVMVLTGLTFFVVGTFLFGEELYNLHTSVHRSWKIGTVAGGLSFCISLLLVEVRSKAFVPVAVAATLLSLFSCLLMPRRDLFLNFSTSDGLISTGIVLAPALLAWTFVIVSQVRPRTGKELLGTGKVRRAVLCGRVIFLVGVPAVLAAGLFGILLARVIHSGTSQTLVKPLAGWLFACTAGVACLTLATMGSLFVLRTSGGFRWMRGSAALVSFLVGIGCFARFGCLPGHRQIAYAVVCVDRNIGGIRWLQEVAHSAKLTDLREINSRATPTPVATSDRLCAYFGSAGLFGLDHSGHIKWRVEDLDFQSEYGVGHSPTLEDGVVVLVNDDEAPAKGPGPKSQIAAFNISDGHALWRKERIHSESGSASFTTPIIRTILGKKTVLVRGWEDLVAYDLQSGQVRWTWRVKHRGNRLVASMIADDKRLYLMDATRVMAKRFDVMAAGLDELAWAVPLSGEKSSSPVLVDGFLFVVTETGLAMCIDVERGAVQWKRKLPGRFFASVVASGERVLFTDEAGATTLATHDPQGALTTGMAFGENIYSTPVPQTDGLLVRTVQNLYWFGANNGAR
jgi:outer membrane protein assembly factor BamB